MSYSKQDDRLCSHTCLQQEQRRCCFQCRLSTSPPTSTIKRKEVFVGLWQCHMAGGVSCHYFVCGKTEKNHNVTPVSCSCRCCASLEFNLLFWLQKDHAMQYNCAHCQKIIWVASKLQCDVLHLSDLWSLGHFPTFLLPGSIVINLDCMSITAIYDYLSLHSEYVCDFNLRLPYCTIFIIGSLF